MRLLAVLALVLALVLVTGASGASSDHNRRLAGPFCVGKRNVGPLHGLLRAGVVRSIAANEACRPWEVRKLGLALNLLRGPAGPAGPAGPKGDTGSTGANGATGATGAVGATGVAGAIGATGATGPAGPAGPAGMNGKDGKNGIDGKNGVDGKDGKDGLGNATIMLCVSKDGGLSFGGFDGPQPATSSYGGMGGGGGKQGCDDHDLVLHVVIVR